MTEPLMFFVPGRPFKKERPRFGRGRAYTHPETVAAEDAVRWYARKAFGITFGINFTNAGNEPRYGNGPLRVTLQFYFLRPKSHRGAQLEQTWHAQRPDIDNMEKLVMDALNPSEKNDWCGVWKDDGQVAFKIASKEWVDDPALEGTRVIVEALI